MLGNLESWHSWCWHYFDTYLTPKHCFRPTAATQWWLSLTASASPSSTVGPEHNPIPNGGPSPIKGERDVGEQIVERPHIRLRDITGQLKRSRVQSGLLSWILSHLNIFIWIFSSIPPKNHHLWCPHCSDFNSSVAANQFFPFHFFPLTIRVMMSLLRHLRYHSASLVSLSCGQIYSDSTILDRSRWFSLFCCELESHASQSLLQAENCKAEQELRSTAGVRRVGSLSVGWNALWRGS